MKSAKGIFTIPLLLSLWLTSAKVFAAEGSVLFGNGDRLTGRALKIDENNHLIWNSEILLSEVPLKLENILELSTVSGARLFNGANHVAKLSLTNGDSVKGELEALDDDHVTINTPYGGSLKIRRSMAANLDISRAERTLYAGPFNIADWVIAEGDRASWVLQNGALISRGDASIARKLDIPEQVRFSFNTAWEGSLRLRVLLRSDDGTKKEPESCYELFFNGRTIYLRKRSPKRIGGGIIGQQAHIRELSEKENARFDVYLDQATGEIALYMDGTQIQVWSDEDPAVGSPGDWVHFVSEERSPVRISNIEMSEWLSGKLPDDRVPALPEGEDEESGQKIILQNGDVLIGEIGLVKDGVLHVETVHTPVKVPIIRMSSVMLTEKNDPGYEEPKREAGDVRAWLRSGGRITFKLRSLSEGKIVGTSQTFGAATFDLDAFSRIEFNIYNEKFLPLRLNSDWLDPKDF